MGRGRVEIKRIDNAVSRGATFYKRRGGLLKKARELAVLCDAQVGVLVFSSKGKPADYFSPNTSWSELIQRYESTTATDIERQQMFTEIQRLRQERDHLAAILRMRTGEDLSSVATKEELDDLQQQLESTLAKVRERKDELLTNLCGHQCSCLSSVQVCQMKEEDGQRRNSGGGGGGGGGGRAASSRRRHRRHFSCGRSSSSATAMSKALASCTTTPCGCGN